MQRLVFDSLMFNTSLDILKAMPLPDDVRQEVTNRYPDKMTPEEKFVYDEFAQDWYERLYLESREMRIKQYLLEHNLQGQLEIPDEDMKRINLQIEQEIFSLFQQRSVEGDINKLREQLSAISKAS